MMEGADLRGFTEEAEASLLEVEKGTIQDCMLLCGLLFVFVVVIVAILLCSSYFCFLTSNYKNRFERRIYYCKFI